jgi:hypothetical protein
MGKWGNGRKGEWKIKNKKSKINPRREWYLAGKFFFCG